MRLKSRIPAALFAIAPLVLAAPEFTQSGAAAPAAQSSPGSQSSNPGSRPQVRLGIKDGRSQFEIGDLITLELVFSDPGYVEPPDWHSLTPIQRAMQAGHPAPGHHIVNDLDYGDLADTVAITPATGWFQWQGKSGHDQIGANELTDHEIRVPLNLNQGYGFRKPGHYEVSVTTYRLDGKPMTTNAVGLELTARSAGEERKLVRALEAKIATVPPNDSCCCGEQRTQAAGQLGALPGDDAVRAKVHWLVAAVDDDDDIQSEMGDGMAASRNYDLQLKLLEDAWRNPNVIPDTAVLRAMDSTRSFMAGRTLPGWRMTVGFKPPDAVEQHLAEAHHADIQTIVDSLPQRSGKNLADTAYFLMEFAGLDARQLAVVRPVAVAQFGHMEPIMQGMLLGATPEIRDPKLIPALRAILDKPPAEDLGYGDALTRLLELDPAGARPYVVREICNPHSDVQMKQMADLPDADLPETDACLLQQIAANASVNKPNGVTPWPEKALIAARFASDAIYPQVLALYRAHPEWNAGVRGALIAYMVRWHPEMTDELLPPSDISRFSDPDHTFNEVDDLILIFNEVLRARHARYPEPLDLALRAELANGTDGEAAEALYYLCEFGTQEDAEVAIARLDRLAADWNGRETELTSPTATPKAKSAFQLRQALVLALWSKHSAWILPEAERQRIKKLCVGSNCAQWPPDGLDWNKERL